MTEQSNFDPEEAYLAKFAETSPAAITRVDKNGHITYANSRAEEVLDLEESEATNRTYDDPVWQITDFEGKEFPDDKLPFSIVQNTEESVEDVRHAIEWPDGKRKLLSINASPLFNDEGEFDGMVSVIEDITDQVREKRDLKRSRDRYQKFFEKSGEAIYVLKMGGENHGEILDANPPIGRSNRLLPRRTHRNEHG